MFCVRLSVIRSFNLWMAKIITSLYNCNSFIPARRETILPEGTYIVQYRLGGTSRTGKNIAVKISRTIKRLPCPTKKGEEQGRLS